LPAEAFAVFGMTLGFPDSQASPQVKPRLPRSVILHREQYEPSRDAAVEQYNERLRGFRWEQNLPDILWTDQGIGRGGGPEALMGRHVLGDVLRSMGFGLR
jgi:hypothetical protein